MRPPKYRLDETRKLTKKEKHERLIRQIKGPTLEKPIIDPKIAKPQPDNSWDLRDWLAIIGTVAGVISGIWVILQLLQYFGLI